MNDNKIKCMYFEKRFKEKPEGKQCGWVQKNLVQINIGIDELADALVHGASFKPAVLVGGNKAENWAEQQLFGLDFDNGTRIEDTYNKVISLGMTPCFMYTTFSHKEEHHKFRMIFCNDTVITDGNIRDRLQATIMGVIGGIDEVCFNRDRLFFGGRGQVVLHPDYEARINAESIIEKYWNDDYEQYISNAKPKSKKKTTVATTKSKDNTDKEYQPYENLNVKAIKEHDVEYLRKLLAHEPIQFENKSEFWDYIYAELDIAELIDIDNPRSFCCVLHDDRNPSTNIFTTHNGIDNLTELELIYQQVASGTLSEHMLSKKLARADELKALIEGEIADVNYEPTVTYEPKIDTGSTSKQAETDWKKLLDAELNLLDKQLEAGLITFQDYVDKRKGIIEDYYRDGKIKAEDY